MFGGTVITDGYTDKDLGSVTLDKLQEFMRSKSTDFYKMMDELVRRLQTPIEIPVKAENPEEVLKPIADFLKENEDLKKENAELKAEIEKLKNPNKYLYNGATAAQVLAATEPKPINIPKRKPGRPAKK